MPSIEELLNEAESHMAAQPVNDVLEIDPETREISIPDSEIILGVETDQKAERKYFHCPKIVGNNIDLSKLELFVVFQNASNKEEGKDRYHVTDVKTTSDGYITFSWELSAKVTAYKGDVQFVVCAIKTDSSGVKQNVWNTTIAIGKCLIGLSSDMSASEEQSASDLYTQLVSELNSTASAKMTEVTNQIQTVGANQVSNVNNAGTTQVTNVQDKGTEVLASIPDTYTELDASVKQLSDQMRGKAPVIVESITSQSGKPVSVSDSAEMQLQGLRLYGKSKQVVTTGKNLLNPYLKKSTTVNGITCVPNGDGTYTLNGTATGKTDFIVFTISKISSSSLFGKTLKIVGCPSGGKRESKYAFYLQRQLAPNYTPIIADEGNGSLSLEINDSIDGAWSAWIRINSGYTCNNLVFKPMITTDLSATYDDFEPYTGGKPSPSPEYPQAMENVGGDGSIGVEITGKNLFDLNKEYTSDTNVNTFTLTLKPSTKYTLSTDFPATANVASIYFGGSSSDINGVWKDRPKTFATDSSGNITVKIRTLKQDNAPAIFNDVLNGVYHIQLEEGNTATSYEPYKQSTTTIPLSNGLPGIPVTTGGNYTDSNGQQYICDEIDFKRGKYVQRVWKGVLDGSSDEKWTFDGSYAQRVRMILDNANLGTYIQRDIASMCSSLLWNRNVYSDTDRKNGYLINNNTLFVRVAETIELNTESDFKAWLASNPVTLQYVLATPIETDLTEVQIQAYKSLTTFKPTSIISNDAGAQMEVEYAADTKTWVTNKINTLIKEAITS